MPRDAVDIEIAARTSVAGLKPVGPSGLLRRSRSGPVLAARGPDGTDLYGLKWLVPSIAYDPIAIRRLKGDFDKIAGIGHSGIARVDALHQIDAGVVVVSEIVEGAPLRAVLSEGTLSAEAVAVLAVDVMETLAWIHNAGVLHRDITPDAIVINSKGNSFLVDIGIAAPVYALVGPSGTPPYIAGELWDDNQPSQASDFYALATVLYEAFAGHAPFAGRRVAAIRAKHLRGHIDLEALPEGLREGIAEGLQRDPASRPASAAQWRQSLLALVNTHLGTDWEKRGREDLAACSLAAGSAYPSALVSSEPGAGTTAAPEQKAISRRSVWAAAALLLLFVGGFALVGFRHAPVLPKPTPRGTALAVATPQATFFATLTPAASPTPTPTPSPTPTPRPAPSQVVVSLAPTPCPTPTPTPTPTPSPTPTPTHTPTPSPSPSPTHC